MKLTECVLLGKFLTTRHFSRFTLSEIVDKLWRVVVHRKKIGENRFKFTFSKVEDKMSVFVCRP